MAESGYYQTCDLLTAAYHPKGRATLNHSTNGIVVDSPDKNVCQTFWKSVPNLFLMNLIFYNINERVQPGHYSDYLKISKFKFV